MVGSCYVYHCAFTYLSLHMLLPNSYYLPPYVWLMLCNTQRSAWVAVCCVFPGPLQPHSAKNLPATLHALDAAQQTGWMEHRFEFDRMFASSMAPFKRNAFTCATHRGWKDTHNRKIYTGPIVAVQRRAIVSFPVGQVRLQSTNISCVLLINFTSRLCVRWWYL